MGQDLEELLKYASQDVLDINQQLLQDPSNMGGNKIRKSQKYRNQPLEVDGRRFDSKAEARYYELLKDLETRNIISDLECQPKFSLLESFVYRGKRIRGITYRADFKYFDVEKGLWYIVDVKSTPTSKEQSFRNKWKLLQYAMRDQEDTVLELVIT